MKGGALIARSCRLSLCCRLQFGEDRGEGQEKTETTKSVNNESEIYVFEKNQ